MRYIIRKFEALTPLELYTLLKLRQEIFILEQACLYPDIDGKDEGAYHLMAFEGDRLLGCLRILEKGVSFEDASIGRVAVAFAHRGRGIAKAIMLEALAFIERERKETRVRISAQSYTIPFYAGVGFRVVGEEYLEDGIWHVEMVWGA